jgi:chorismate mutase-like protein
MSKLAPFRLRLDELDDRITELLGERFAVCRDIAVYKRDHQMPMMQPERVQEVRQRYLARGVQANLPPAFVEDLFELIIAATCTMEDEIIDAPVTSKRGTPK